MPYYSSATPSYAPLFLAPNVMHWSALATSTDMTTSISNPSSQINTMPGSYVLDPLRHRMWRSRGCFRINSSATKGYVFAPNNKIYIDEGLGGGEIAVTLSNANYSDPLACASAVAATLDAHGSLTRDYTVAYSDPRTSGSSATFKWTISADGTFSINVVGKSDTVTTSLGFGTGANYTGAATYTGENKACHTEEYIIIKVPDNVTQKLYNTELGNSVDVWQWLCLLDTNIRFGLGDTFANGGPYQMPKVYLYGYNSGNTVEFDDQDASWTEGTDMFTFPSTDPFPSYIGIDSQLYGGGWSAGYSGEPIYRHRMILADIADWTNSYCPGNAQASYGGVSGKACYLKIKISDPRHPDGFCQIGTALLAPGWYPHRTQNLRWEWMVNDEHKAQLMPGGSRWANEVGAFRRSVGLSFDNVSDGDTSYNTDGADSPWVEWNHRLFARWNQDRITEENNVRMPSPNTASLGVGRQPLVFIDRGFNPYVNHEKKNASGTYNRQGYTPGAMYCTVAKNPKWQGAGAASNYWDFDVELVEDLP